MFGWIAVALAGWLLGSFLNQCVDRLGHGPRPPLPHGEGTQAVSLLHPARSICLSCGAPIAWSDNVPILSYLLRSGRCRHCGTAIGRRTLLLEIATPLIALGIFSAWGWSVAAVGAWLAAAWTLVAVPLRREGTRWSVAFLWLGVAFWSFFFWAAGLGWAVSF